MEIVYILWTKEAMDKFFSIDRSERSISLILANLTEYEFDSVEESEAFRLGLCEVSRITPTSAMEFTELMLSQVKRLRKHEKGMRRKKSTCTV